MEQMAPKSEIFISDLSQIRDLLNGHELYSDRLIKNESKGLNSQSSTFQ